MYIVKCKGKWKDSGQQNLYISTSLIKTQVFTAQRRDSEMADKLNFVPWFHNQACSKLNTSLTLEPNAQKLYHYILSHIFTCSLGKRFHYQCYQNPPVGPWLMKLHTTPPSTLILLTWVPQSKLAFGQTLHTGWPSGLRPSAMDNPTVCSLACRWRLQSGLLLDNKALC